MWLERGVFSLLALKEGSLLELSCGDGFNARNFYSFRSSHVIACDLDASAVATAKRKNRAENIEFVVADIRSDMPAGEFDNIVWDFAFPLTRYFSPDEIRHILAQIKNRLAPRDGVLSGYTEAETAPAPPGAYDFRSIQDVQEFLRPYFRNVTVFETRHPGRRNFYFWASDGLIPFHSEWQDGLTCQRRVGMPETRSEGG
jgi:cyclopropane fatty-acyl-phospholipid synthase-like methyltransferase